MTHALKQPAKPHLTATLILACLAQFMVILDVSVVNVALPSIKHALSFTEDGLQWVVNAYTVTFAGFLLLGGRAADLLGRRRVFVVGLVLFSFASLAGGFADSGTVLIIARLVQGLGAAVVAPASLSILTSTFTEPAERHRAVGIWGAMGGAGGAAGVLLGGIITDALSWRWIFFVNLPIGLATAFFSQRMLLEGRNEHATRNFDFMGAVTATAGLSAIIFGDRAHQQLRLGRPDHAALDRRRHRAAARLPRARGPVRQGAADAAAAVPLTPALGGQPDPRGGRRVHLCHVVLPLAVPAGRARVLGDQDGPGVPADDGRDLAAGSTDRVEAHHARRRQAPAGHRHGGASGRPRLAERHRNTARLPRRADPAQPADLGSDAVCVRPGRRSARHPACGRRRPDWRRRWPTPRGCSAARSGWRSWRRSRPRTRPACCSTPLRPSTRRIRRW